MQAYLDWTLKTIRQGGSNLSWMEERRLEWTPLAVSRLENLLNGYTFVLLTDSQRSWFANYILNSINTKTNNRPLLPFISLEAFLPNKDIIKSNQDQDRELLEDMLSLAFPSGYIFFYIGKGNDYRSQIAKRKDDSFLWLLDERVQNSFFLSTQDEDLDVKLIQLFKLMNKTIDALLFAEVFAQDDQAT